MTPDRPVANGQQLPNTTDSADGVLVELAQVRKHAVALLAELNRPPRNLRIQAGPIIVDIAWPDEAEAVASGSLAGGLTDGAAIAVELDGGAVTDYLTSPVVGVFYHAREPGADPFVSVGSLVRPGQQIGIVEAMKLMIPVEADRSGRITDVLKANGAPVEYDEPLFALAAENPES
jgi:acetyl-CoA carboxylase biotin carboxyl carrier protein